MFTVVTPELEQSHAVDYEATKKEAYDVPGGLAESPAEKRIAVRAQTQF